MAVLADIGWGRYDQWEGPLYHGVERFTLPENHDEADRIIAVISAAEGGRFDAINMYDRAIVSVGLIQWIELSQFSVSNMLGQVAETLGEDWLNSVLAPALQLTNATFKKTASGKWRFHVNGVEVKDSISSRQLFSGCTGVKGSWTPAAKVRGKTWAAALATVFEDPRAQKVQIDFTRSRLNWFVMKDAQAVVFDEAKNDNPWVEATRAVFYSYAVNSPKLAAELAMKASLTTQEVKWSEDWCIHLIKTMVFGGHAGLWSVRYNSIRPVVESTWGISLPKNAKDLSRWEPSPDIEVTEAVEQFSSPIGTAVRALTSIFKFFR